MKYHRYYHHHSPSIISISSLLAVLIVSSMIVFSFLLSPSKVHASNIDNNNNSTIPGAVDPALCTPDLKRFVAHLFNETLNGKPILKILNPCVTVTGTVIGKSESRIPHIRVDADLVINLLPDPEFKSLASAANTRFRGAIHLEAICQGNNFDPATGIVNNVPSIHVGDCKGFNGPHFPIPKVGDRLKVTGVYAQDIDEGGHMEIHPVYKIESIGALSAPLISQANAESNESEFSEEDSSEENH